ncbi:MAG: GGDEF domain-containing protein [Clostridiales bacterium]|nr:GGDEF domain-containing protein [Clostridiales bacterium]MBR3248040.1 GGDEF domain-containing protein [Clostridiales bacterium]
MKICAFIGDMYRDYSASIIRSIDAYARKKGHRVDVFGNCSVPSNNPLQVIGYKSILSLPKIHDYDGIILCADTIDQAGLSKELIEELLNDPDVPPIVCIRAEINGFFNVVPDNRAIMHEIARYVISKCETGDIGFVTGRDDLLDSAERRAGFEDAMREVGYEVREDMIFHGNYWINQGPETADFFTKEDGALPEAIICSNDYEAVALIDELIQRGFSVPGDTMISGIDNIADAGDHIPSLTTIEISEETLANAAMELLEKIHANENTDLYVNVSGDIVFRESTGDEDTGRDVYQALRDLKVAKSNSIESMREYVLLSTDFEECLTRESLIKVTLENLRKFSSVKECYLCRYCENDRLLSGYIDSNGAVGEAVSFPNDKLLPEGFLDDVNGTVIFLPVVNKNVVYGYAVLVVDTAENGFINEKIEFIFMQVGQVINKLDLYQKYFGIADIMDLYIKDSLTGLLNRKGFDKRITELFDKDRKKLYDLAVVSIDMDGLKYINDTFGHNSGDEAIKQIAKCVYNALNPKEFVARMGGDEFEAVLILSDVGRIGQFIRKVRTNIKEANAKGKYPFELSASIGTCELTEWGELVDCMSKADKAMYLEKKAKKKNRKD